MDNRLYIEIAKFSPNEGNWLKLEGMFEQVFSSANPTIFYPAIFTLFEQFHDEDGAGVFWSALHGMESIGNYEADLLASF